MATEVAASSVSNSTLQPQQHMQAQQQAAASANRILFLVVVSGADLDCLEDPKPTGPRYTRDSLRNLLQLLGCKPRLAFKVMLAVFQAVDSAVTTARQQRISRKTFQVCPRAGLCSGLVRRVLILGGVSHWCPGLFEAEGASGKRGWLM